VTSDRHELAVFAALDPTGNPVSWHARSFTERGPSEIIELPAPGASPGMHYEVVGGTDSDGDGEIDIVFVHVDHISDQELYVALTATADGVEVVSLPLFGGDLITLGTSPSTQATLFACEPRAGQPDTLIVHTAVSIGGGWSWSRSTTQWFGDRQLELIDTVDGFIDDGGQPPSSGIDCPVVR
jgi:hypothetical protein